MSEFTRPGNLSSQTSNEAEMEDVVNKMLELEQSQGGVINREGEVGQIQQDIIKESNLIASELKSNQLADTGTQATDLNESLDTSRKPNSADLSTISDLNLDQAAMLDESIPNETVQALLSLPDSLPAIPYTQSIPKERNIQSERPVPNPAIEASIGHMAENLKDQTTAESPMEEEAAQSQEKLADKIEDTMQDFQDIVVEPQNVSSDLVDKESPPVEEIPDEKPTDTIDESHSEQETVESPPKEEFTQLQEMSAEVIEDTAQDKAKDSQTVAVETLIDISEPVDKRSPREEPPVYEEPTNTIDKPQEELTEATEESVNDSQEEQTTAESTPEEKVAQPEEKSVKIIEDTAQDSQNVADEAEHVTSDLADKEFTSIEETADVVPMETVDELKEEQAKDTKMVHSPQPNVSRPKRSSRENTKSVQKKSPEKRAPKASIRPPRAAARQTMAAITTPKPSKAPIPATEPRKKTSDSVANYELKRYFCDTCQYGTDRLNNIIYHMKLSCAGTQRRYAASVAEWKLELQSPRSNSKKATR